MISQLISQRRENTYVLDFIHILGASLFLAVMAQIAIPLPFTPVPITMQTFGMMAVGALLGSRKGALAVLCYLAEASMGLPVLAGGVVNPVWILLPSAGYLIGMVPMAFFTGLAYERFTSFFPRMAATAMVSVGQLAFGMLWLGHFFVGWENALVMGFTPFIAGSVLKWIVLNASFLCKKS